MDRPADPGADPGERAAALHEEAIVLREAGSLFEAEAVCQQSVALFEAVEGPTSVNLANALVELGGLLEALDRLPQAGVALDRALTILRPVVGWYGDAGGDGGAGDVNEDGDGVQEELIRLTVLAESHRASTFRAAGALAEAEAGCRRAIALAEGRLPPGDPLIAETLNGLGVVHKFQGRYDEAEPLYLRAMAIAEAAGAGLDAATLFHNLGGLAHARGDFETGEPLARRSVELHEALLGKDHPTTAADRAAWGALLEGLGRTAEAEAAYAEALAVFEARLGPRSLEAASALTALGAVQHARGATEEGEQSYRRSLDIREAVLGPDHFDVGLTINNLAMLLIDRGGTAEAAPLLDRAHDIFRTALGPEHPHTRAVAENRSALTRRKTGD